MKERKTVLDVDLGFAFYHHKNKNIVNIKK